MKYVCIAKEWYHFVLLSMAVVGKGSLDGALNPDTIFYRVNEYVIYKVLIYS